MSLKGSQLQHLRGLAHHLDPIVHVGKGGVSDTVVEAANVALTDHELVKVRLPQVEKSVRKQMAGELDRGRLDVRGQVELLGAAMGVEPVIVGGSGYAIANEKSDELADHLRAFLRDG